MMKVKITALLIGFLFSIGLGISGMMDPVKVQGFLDLAGRWDPSLAFVMGGAVMVTLLIFPLVTRRKSPVFTDEFGLPTKNEIDKPLIIGAILFGTGWAISGLCPGPALANAFTFNIGVIGYIVAMFVGFWLHKKMFST